MHRPRSKRITIRRPQWRESIHFPRAIPVRLYATLAHHRTSHNRRDTSSPFKMTEPAKGIRAVYLLGGHCLPSSASFEGRQEQTLILEELALGEHPYQVRDGLFAPACRPPRFWDGKVLNIHAWECKTFGDYKIVISCVQLTTDWFERDEPRHKYSGHLNALFGSIVGDHGYIQSQRPGLEPLVTPSVLYVQSCLAGDHESDSASAALRSVGLDSLSDVTSAHIEGTRFFPGLFGFGDHEWRALSALDNRPGTLDPHRLALPATVCSLVYLQALTDLASNLARRASEMPFVGITTQEYVQGFLANNKLRPMLRDYQQTFLRDKERNVELRLRLEREERNLEEEGQHNLFLLWKERAFDAVPRTEALRWPGKVTVHIEHAYRQRMAALRRRLETSRSQEDAVSELLRDRAVAASAQTNLRLQLLVFILTCITAVPVVEEHWAEIVRFFRYVQVELLARWPL